MSTPSARLLKFPLPPQANHLYRNVVHKGKSFRAKARGYREYEAEVTDWAWQNTQALSRVREMIAACASHQVFRIDQVFLMERSRILTLDGRAKKSDTFNRIKAMHDMLAPLLHLDDCRFWSGFTDKLAVERREDEGVIITLSPWQAKCVEHYLDPSTVG